MECINVFMVKILLEMSMFEFLKTSSGVVDGCAKQEELEIFKANAEGGWYGTYEALLSFPQLFLIKRFFYFLFQEFFSFFF